MKKIVLALLAIILVGIISVGAWYYFSISPVSQDDTEIEVTVELGSGTVSIAEQLEERGLIRNALAFKIYVKLNNISDFQAGTYYLKQSMSLKEITDVLKTGVMYDKNQITITYLEGKNMRWLAKEIATITNNTEEDVYNLLQDEEYIDSLIEKYWFITDDIKNENIYYSLEGYLFPDTYALTSKDASVEEIFEKMLDQMGKVLDEYKEKIQVSGFTVNEILTIASIIEMESMTEKGRENVASVIYNRLDLNMAIQSDVTTYYAIKVDVGERDLYQKELDTYNPYNTRGPNMEGKLPVGPISSVGRSSIKAAIEPSNTNYIFFVADKNGELYFSETDSEHSSIINKLREDGLWYEY